MIYVSKKFLKKSFKSNKVITKLFDLNHESILYNIEELVDLYIKTDGIGKSTALRLALHLVKSNSS